MHLLGRDITVTATQPDKAQQKLVRVPNWDFNWQTTYTLRQPIKLPAGSRIDVEAHYNNSEDNINNPNTPPKDVTWGEQTTDEMLFAFVHYTIDAEHLTQGVSATEPGRPIAWNNCARCSTKTRRSTRQRENERRQRSGSANAAKRELAPTRTLRNEVWTVLSHRHS
jgi:hypothetical protein